MDSDPPALFGEATTFEDYCRRLEPYTPERAAELAGVRPDDIRMLADLFGRRDLRITSLWCMGVNQHTRGTAMNTLIHGIHLLSGHFGRPGDAPTSLTGQPSACGTAREVGTLAHTLPGGRVVAKEPHRRQAEELWKLPEVRDTASSQEPGVPVTWLLSQVESSSMPQQETRPSWSSSAGRFRGP